jgi:hypothetical protein
MIEYNGPNDYEEWEVVDPPEHVPVGPDSPASDSMDGMYANSTTSSTDLTKEARMAPGVENPTMVNLEDMGIFTDQEETRATTQAVHKEPLTKDDITILEEFYGKKKYAARPKVPSHINQDKLLAEQIRNNKWARKAAEICKKPPGTLTIEDEEYTRSGVFLYHQHNDECYRPIMGDCRAPEHYPEPHPGKRVDVWAYQEDTSPQYYRDNTDRVFYTPPDSPTLKREDATVHQKTVRASPFEQRKARKPRSRKTRNDAVYVNSNEALALYEEDTVRSAQQARETMTTPDYEDWVDRAERKWAMKQKHYYKASSQVPQPNYALDFRNPRHVYLTWAACGYDECQTHYHDKCGAGHFPKKDGCKWMAYDCPTLECPKHLFDKRMTGVFPGLPDKEAQTLSLLVNGKCTQDQWQLCLNEDCTRHADVKAFNGFDRPAKPFLGLKQLWPNTVTKSAQHPSTSSQ